MKIKRITGIKVEGLAFISVINNWEIDKIERVEYSDRGTWYQVGDEFGRFQEFNARYISQIVYEFEDD